MLMAGLGSAAMPARAEGVVFSGGATLLTDYRLRGASLSDRKPVIQGVVAVDVPLNDSIGLWGGIWASSLDKDAGAGAMETDLFIGAKAKLGKVALRARYLRLVFHDDTPANIDFDQYEVGANVPAGDLTLGAGAIHDEYNGGGHSTYGYVSAGYAIKDTGIGVNGLVGYEDGSNWNGKVNWALGATYSTGPVTFGATYIDTNKFSPTSRGTNRAGAGVIFSVGGHF
jgi:uncharacterized protein (TIGR02001 family)